MSQPIWRFIVNLGDASPLDHGGYFVYEDTTGVYGFEAERIEPNDNGTIEVHRVCLDRLREVRENDRLYLVPYKYEKTWPHPLSAYVEWFAEDLESVASYVDRTLEDLREALCSADGIKRAEAYRAIYDYQGWVNGDESPMTLTRSEAKKRYRKECK